MYVRGVECRESGTNGGCMAGRCTRALSPRAVAASKKEGAAKRNSRDRSRCAVSASYAQALPAGSHHGAKQVLRVQALPRRHLLDIPPRLGAPAGTGGAGRQQLGAPAGTRARFMGSPGSALPAAAGTLRGSYGSLAGPAARRSSSCMQQPGAHQRGKRAMGWSHGSGGSSSSGGW